MKTTDTQHNAVIRSATRSDIAQITEIYNYYVEHTSITFDLEPQSFDAREEWFAQFDASGPHQIVVAELDHVIAGYACSTKLRPRAAYNASIETTIYVHPKHTGLGLGKVLYGKLFELLETQEVHRAYGVIAMPNTGSIALHEAFGFKRVGMLSEAGFKFGEYIDVVWYEKAMRT